MRERLGENRFVLKTDVRSYYASIDHELLLERLERHVADHKVVALVAQYLKRTSERGGLFYDFERGISRGCPLSPIMGAFFLSELDEALERTGLFFVRYMDDVIVLALTRWRLRWAVKLVNRVLTGLRLEKAPEETFIGRIDRGFDFLGFRISPKGITVATATWRRFVERALRLYEQNRREPCGSPPVGCVRQVVLRVPPSLRLVNFLGSDEELVLGVAIPGLHLSNGGELKNRVVADPFTEPPNRQFAGTHA